MGSHQSCNFASLESINLGGAFITEVDAYTNVILMVYAQCHIKCTHFILKKSLSFSTADLRSQCILIVYVLCACNYALLCKILKWSMLIYWERGGFKGESILLVGNQAVCVLAIYRQSRSVLR